MYKQIKKYRNNKIKKKLKNYIDKGILFSSSSKKNILKTRILENSDLGVKVYLLPNDKSMLPQTYVKMLIKQMANDIFPLILMPERAPFAVLRSSFCYLDHIATLRFGKKNSMGNLLELFRSFGTYPFIQTLYNKYYQDLIQLYRHDLIHSTQPLPKIRRIDKKSNFQVVYWHLSSNLLQELENILNTSNINGAFEEISVKMRNEKNRKNLCHLRLIKNTIHVNVWCLFFDTIAYLTDYADNLFINSDEVKEFLKNYIDNFIYSLFKLIKVKPLQKRGSKQIIFNN